MSTTDPIDPAFVAKMNGIARAIDDLFNGDGPTKVGFLLLTAKVGEIDNGRVNFIGNCERDDSKALMREVLARWEGRHVDQGGVA